MKGTFARWGLYFALFVLFLLHNDLWFWDDPRLIFGLPIGLLYHILFCVAASALMLGLVHLAWPANIDVGEASDVEHGEGESS